MSRTRSSPRGNCARKAVEKEFGDRVQTSFVESVPEGADAERVLRDMAQQGNKLIFGTTFGYMEPMLKVAADFPDVKFEHATGYKNAPNMGTYDSRTYQGAYMAGVIAGAMTKTNTLGVVASIPIPEVIRNINSFTLGAQSTNPNVKTKVVWVNEWFSPPKETEAATSLINGGADILMQNTDSSAVLQTAEKMGKRGFGWDSDMKAYAPKAHLGSSVINWAPFYIKAVGDTLDGKWTNTPVWWGVKEGAIDLVSLADDVPAARRSVVETRLIGEIAEAAGELAATHLIGIVPPDLPVEDFGDALEITIDGIVPVIVEAALTIPGAGLVLRRVGKFSQAIDGGFDDLRCRNGAAARG